MNHIVAVENEITMSSLDFLNNFINPARIEMGEKPHVKHAHFFVKVI